MRVESTLGRSSGILNTDFRDENNEIKIISELE